MLTHQKVGELTAILAPREGQLCKFSEALGADWTQCVIGFFFAGVDGHDNDLPGPTELRTVTDDSDRLFVGLKNSANRTLPGFANSYFLGVRSTGAVSKCLAPSSGAGFFADSNEECSAVGYSGTTLVDGGVLTDASLQFPLPDPENGFNAFYAVKISLSSRGTSSQAAHISTARTAKVDGIDYSKSALIQAINSATFGAPNTVPWNDGFSAKTLPDAVWIRLPFFNNRFRIHALTAIKTNP